MRFDIASIDRAEVLRYLGYAGQDMTEELSARIDAMVARCLSLCQPAGAWRVYDVAGVRTRDDGIPELELDGCALAPYGRDITAHLAGARAVGVLACTLGIPSERELRRLSQADPLDAVVFDAACTTLVERAADATEAQIVAEGRERGLFPNARYSPGHGDWGLDAQPQMLAAVDAQRRLGLTLTPTLLLVPTKSVTAVIGLFDEPQPTHLRLCSKCHCREFCEIRKTGRTCRG
ncbi:MAG: vitamin B12 dependent methionine synthase [Coriobacteriia bacterium]|nr:vitamin B12 dependent methionine synthase [Coriobacteriia bacterium]MBS5477152.1 vitamin B12 dependent methionine synthase [Coriobacteriia bacterium]